MHTEIEASESELATLDTELATLFAEVYAITARALIKLAEFDARQCWAQLGYKSCAHWLNFRCGLGLGAAREHVRVAKALRALPALRAAFLSGTLSYSKLRALSRIATSDNDTELLAVANETTAAQLEKIVRATARVTKDDAQRQLLARGVDVGFDEDGAFFMRVRLLPDEGCRLLHTLDRLMPEGDADAAAARRADALVAMASEKNETEVVVHVDAQRCTDQSCTDQLCAEQTSQVETPRGERIAISAETSRRLGCDASVVRMRHDAAGRVLDVGRRSRQIPAAMRRALAERDRGCQFPGCSNQLVDAHHVRHWQDGGETKLSNLTTLCRRCHRLVHEGGYRVELRDDGRAVFFTPNGKQINGAQPLPAATGLRPPTLPWQGPPLTWRQIDYGFVVSRLAT